MYIEVVLPLPLEGTFTYEVSDGSIPKVGCRVIVPLGSRKIYTGLVYEIKQQSQTPYKTREIIDVLDDQPVVTDFQLTFITWVSKYYLCTLGDAYNACLPAGLKLTSESYASINPDIDVDDELLPEKEDLVLQWLKEKDLTFDEIRDLTGLKHPYRIIKNLLDKNLITIHEKIKDRYVSKKETRIRLHPDFTSELALDDLTGRLEKRQKQLDVIVSYLKEVPVLEDPATNARGISKKDLLLENVSSSSLKTLIKNGIMESWDEIIDRFQGDDQPLEPLTPLSEEQKAAKSKIEDSYSHYHVCLLKGVTGSGKTEIYMSLIRDTMEKGKQALLLLPEIALTTQIIKRFRKFFGSSFGVYHSRFSDNERVEIYQKLRKREFNFIIGVRSSVFLPFRDLGLIIVDEEHEPSYKQFDPAPRYHARDAAIYLATLHSNARVLLGSATPSMESIYNVENDKYGFTSLTKRYQDQPLPEIKLHDMHTARKRRQVKGQFSDHLLEEIRQNIERKKQVILFHNRRGYSPYIQCDDCKYIPICPNCDVSLTYHIFRNEMICHYCGHHHYMENACISCGSTNIRTVGSGTEKIEEELSLLMPDVIMKRMDLDTTRTKNAYQEIIDRFEEGDIQILIGTQMVTKGLDFENVSLVGIVDADRMLHFPDFRSHERAFQLISQVSGRAGRKHERGKVIVQTSYPDHPLLNWIISGNENAFIQKELTERVNFNYPPYFRMITIIIRSRDKNEAWNSATEYGKWLRKDLGDKRVLGPVTGPIAKIRTYYIFHIHLKLEKTGINLLAVKEYLRSNRDTLLALPSFKRVLIHFDVDPI